MQDQWIHTIARSGKRRARTRKKRREKMKQIDVACLFIDFREFERRKRKKKKSENRHRLSRSRVKIVNKRILILPTKTTAFLWLFGTSFTRRTNGNYSGMPKSMCCCSNFCLRLRAVVRMHDAMNVTFSAPRQYFDFRRSDLVLCHC